MRILLLDFGSSYVKYSFYDNSTRTNTEVFTLNFPKPIIDENGFYEVERYKIDGILFDIMDKAEANGCTAAFICTQMHGYFIKEGEFSNYISWKDKRGSSYILEAEAKDLFDYGTAIKTNSPRVSLRAYPSLAGKEFFTFGSYITYALTGKNVTHITDACASGLFRADTCLSENLYEGLLLPTAAREIKPCGTYKNIDIYPSMGDHQISFLGANITDGEAVLNFGTAAWLSCLVEEGSERFGGIEYRPYFVKEKRVATLTGLRADDLNVMVSQIKRNANAFEKNKRIRITGGGKDKAGLVVSELEKLGYEVELCNRNVGNEGLRRIADAVCSRRGTMLSEIEFPNFPFVIKKSELDFFIIDNEHGNFQNQTVTTLAMNSKIVDIEAIVRLPSNERTMITKLADGGVTSFLLPMVNEKKDVEKLIEYAKYAPIGKRGVSTTRAHTGYGVSDLQEYMRCANEKMKIYAQVETRAAVNNLDEILSLDALDGIFIGPNDLSCDFNCMGDNEMIKKLISVIAHKCIEKEKPCGIITTNTELIEYALLCGCSMVSYGSEINMLIKGAKEIVNKKFL